MNKFLLTLVSALMMSPAHAINDGLLKSMRCFFQNGQSFGMDVVRIKNNENIGWLTEWGRNGYEYKTLEFINNGSSMAKTFAISDIHFERVLQKSGVENTLSIFGKGVLRKKDDNRYGGFDQVSTLSLKVKLDSVSQGLGQMNATMQVHESGDSKKNVGTQNGICHLVLEEYLSVEKLRTSLGCSNENETRLSLGRLGEQKFDHDYGDCISLDKIFSDGSNPILILVEGAAIQKIVGDDKVKTQVIIKGRHLLPSKENEEWWHPFDFSAELAISTDSKKQGDSKGNSVLRLTSAEMPAKVTEEKYDCTMNIPKSELLNF